MENKIGRYPLDHPRAGGYFVMWANQTLLSTKLKNDHILATFIRILAVAQLTDFIGGRFEKAGMPFSAISIANKAGITVTDLDNLISIGLVTKKAKNGEVFYAIKSWEEHQNPKHQSAKEMGDKVPKESDKKSQHPFSSSSGSTDSSSQHSSTKAKYNAKSKKVAV